METKIYGMRPVMEALLAGKQIEKIVFRQGLEGVQFRELLDEAGKRGVSTTFLPSEQMNHLVRGTHQGVVAYIAQIDYASLEVMVDNALSKRKNPLFVLLDGVSDVRNFGAIARTVECAGADGIILPAKGGAPINAEAVKASAGALLRIDVHKAQNLRIPIFYLKERGFGIVAVTEKGADYMYQVDLTGPVALVMGSEGRGISSSTLALCDVKARIPMAGEIGSLNVSIASALIMYEAVRQRETVSKD